MRVREDCECSGKHRRWAFFNNPIILKYNIVIHESLQPASSDYTKIKKILTDHIQKKYPKALIQVEWKSAQSLPSGQSVMTMYIGVANATPNNNDTEPSHHPLLPVTHEYCPEWATHQHYVKEVKNEDGSPIAPGWAIMKNSDVPNLELPHSDTWQHQGKPVDTYIAMPRHRLIDDVTSDTASSAHHYVQSLKSTLGNSAFMQGIKPRRMLLEPIQFERTYDTNLLFCPILSFRIYENTPCLELLAGGPQANMIAIGAGFLFPKVGHAYRYIGPAITNDPDLKKAKQRIKQDLSVPPDQILKTVRAKRTNAHPLCADWQLRPVFQKKINQPILPIDIPGIIHEHAPARLILMIDSSGSMKDNLKDIHTHTADTLKKMRSAEQNASIMIGTFSEQVETSLPFTSITNENESHAIEKIQHTLQKIIKKLHKKDGHPEHEYTFDAINYALDHIEKIDDREEKKLILVIMDEKDSFHNPAQSHIVKQQTDTRAKSLNTIYKITRLIDTGEESAIEYFRRKGIQIQTSSTQEKLGHYLTHLTQPNVPRKASEFMAEQISNLNLYSTLMIQKKEMNDIRDIIITSHNKKIIDHAINTLIMTNYADKKDILLSILNNAPITTRLTLLTELQDQIKYRTTLHITPLLLRDIMISSLQNDSDASVREKSLDYLIKLAKEDIISISENPFIQALSTGSSQGIKIKAISGLKHLKTDGAQAVLIQELDRIDEKTNNDDIIVSTLIEALNNYKTEEAQDAIIRALKKHASKQIRRTALFILRYRHSNNKIKKALEYIIKTDNDSFIRNYAKDILDESYGH